MDIKSKVPLKCSSCGGAKYIDDPYLIHDTWFVDVVCIKCGRSKDIEAEKLIRTALKNEWCPDLTRLYALCHTDTNKQINFLKKQLGYFPSKTEILEALGKLCQREKLWGQAKEYYMLSLQEHDSASTYHELSLILKKLGKLEDAKTYQQKALDYTLEEENSALMKQLKAPPIIEIDEIS